jgi:ApaG protein
LWVQNGGNSLGSVTLTAGIRVAVAPSYLPDQSVPESRRYVFGYRIRISNESQCAVKLLTRHWIIVDADGDRNEVRGDGVVGQQPELEPGASFVYGSFCPLETEWGTMEGSFEFVDAEGTGIQARIERFYLAARVDEPAADA